MKNRLISLFRPDDRPTLWCALTIAFKLLLFDLLWSLPTTFSLWSTFEFWLSKLLVIGLLIVPGKLFRCWWLQGVVMLLLDGLLIANLMYFRTYYTAIPLDSYALGGNLADFMGSVYDSVRWVDALFPLGTLLFLLLRPREKRCHSHWERRRQRISRQGWLATMAIGIVGFGTCLAVRGGFYKAYDKLRQHAYHCTGTTSMYTLAGDLYFDYLSRQQKPTPEVMAEIGKWLEGRPEYRPLGDSTGVRNHCIVILCESLESWVLERTVEGQELTPCLNRLLREPTTLYAPNVLTQVKGGRSIDAQLLLCAGLLPVNSGTYSSQYPDTHYPTLQKAMHEARQSRNYLLTIDKVSTWNQGVIARSFGTDSILSYRDFALEEAFGTHKRTGDVAFLRQCAEKIRRGEVWPQGENGYLQLITYSGHAPFKLPEELKELHFSDTIPEKMNDYMTTARYTDRALGAFIDFLKNDPRYAQTLIVITGDHEGLADHRRELCNTPAGRGVVSEKPFTPFIVVNSPVGLRYDGVMGQVDMYPTLLNLLQLDDYSWKGLGRSILDPAKPAFAVSPKLEVEGILPDEAETARARKAYDISDKMIRFDYWKP